MKSESIKEITAALAKAQLAFLPIKKIEKVDYMTTKGRIRYSYAPLSEVIEATRKALSDNGLAITQSTILRDGGIILETLLSHSSGEWRSGELYVGKQDQSPKDFGSVLTYMRRYGMSAILNVASEDDDDGGKDGEEETTQEKVESKAVAPPKQEATTAPETAMETGTQIGTEQNTSTGATTTETVVRKAPTGKGVQNLAELKSLSTKHKIGTREALTAIGVGSWTEIADLDAAWKDIKKAFKIE